MYARALLRRVRPRGAVVLVPGAAAIWYSARWYAAASARAASASAGGDLGAISSASYPANDPLEDRWVVARVRLPGGAAAAASSGGGGLLSPVGGPQQPPPQTLLLAAVMDGHGGWQASDFVQAQLAAAVESELQHNADNGSPEQLAAALSRAFERLDREFIARVRPAFEVRARAGGALRG